MNKPARVNFLQNIAIALLSLSALLLLLRVISYETGRSGSLSGLPNLVSSGQAENTNSTDLTAMAAPFNLVITNEYGHSGYLLVSGEESGLEQVNSLLREALGSAYAPQTAADARFREALGNPGIYLDYLVALPSSILSAQLSTELDYGSSVRQLLITREDSGIVLYLRDQAGQITCCATAVSSSALQEAVAVFSASAVFFAFEGDQEVYGHLDPYSVFPNTTVQRPVYTAATPALASDVDQLLTILDFNPHTMSRYVQSDGTVVVRETSRTLYVRPNGTVSCTGDTQAASPLYQVAAAGDRPTEAEAVLAVLNLAEAMLPAEVTSSSSLCLSSLTATAEGYSISLQYMLSGVPIYFGDDTPALTAEIQGDTITRFSLHYRQYTLTTDTYALLPAALAAAAAGEYDGAFLTVGYIDQGDSTVYPGWLAR